MRTLSQFVDDNKTQIVDFIYELVRIRGTYPTEILVNKPHEILDYRFEPIKIMDIPIYQSQYFGYPENHILGRVHGIIDEIRYELKSGTANVCFHDWKEYQGIYEIYDFCTKCDLKREKKL